MTPRVDGLGGPTRGVRRAVVTVACVAITGALAGLSQGPRAAAARSPVVGMAVTTTGGGYWIVDAGGTVSNFGDAQFRGQPDRLARPVTDIASAPKGHGYWIVASDGKVFSFGDASFRGQLEHSEASVVEITPTPTGNGYWLVSADGEIFPFGDAGVHEKGSAPL